jgi:drug/metabolite transporter (DMT)-like permease
VDVDASLNYGLTLLAALLIGTGFVLQQNAAQQEPDSRFLRLGLITNLLRTPRWLAGIAFMVGGQILAAWSIGHLSLAFVEPLLTMNLVFALLIAVPLAKASLKVWEIIGAAILIAGVASLSASRSVTPIGLSFGSVSHWPAAAVIAGIAFLAAHAGLRRPGPRRAMLTGASAGLVFGIQDALTRQSLQILQSSGASALFTTWAPYALIGAGAIGIWLMQSAFNAGPLHVSLPAISAGEPLVGILLGILVFGDRIQITPGMLAVQAGGIAALVVGVILVGRAPALSQLRSWTAPYSLPHSIPGIHPRREDEPALAPPACPPQPSALQESTPRKSTPSTNGPSANGPSSNGPSVNGPSANSPSANSPSANSPSADRPAVSGPSVSGPAVSGPSSNGPAVNGPAVSGPAVSGPSSNGRGAHAAAGPPAAPATTAAARHGAIGPSEATGATEATGDGQEHHLADTKPLGSRGPAGEEPDLTLSALLFPGLVFPGLREADLRPAGPVVRA